MLDALGIYDGDIVFMGKNALDYMIEVRPSSFNIKKKISKRNLETEIEIMLKKINR